MLYNVLKVFTLCPFNIFVRQPSDYFVLKYFLFLRQFPGLRQITLPFVSASFISYRRLF